MEAKVLRSLPGDFAVSLGRWSAPGVPPPNSLLDGSELLVGPIWGPAALKAGHPSWRPRKRRLGAQVPSSLREVGLKLYPHQGKSQQGAHGYPSVLKGGCPAPALPLPGHVPQEGGAGCLSWRYKGPAAHPQPIQPCSQLPKTEMCDLHNMSTS